MFSLASCHHFPTTERRQRIVGFFNSICMEPKISPPLSDATTSDFIAVSTHRLFFCFFSPSCPGTPGQVTSPGPVYVPGEEAHRAALKRASAAEQSWRTSVAMMLRRPPHGEVTMGREQRFTLGVRSCKLGAEAL